MSFLETLLHVLAFVAALLLWVVLATLIAFVMTQIWESTWV